MRIRVQRLAHARRNRIRMRRRGPHGLSNANGGVGLGGVAGVASDRDHLKLGTNCEEVRRHDLL